MEETNYNVEWMRDIIKDVPKNKRIFKICKKILRKNLTYNDFYVLVYALNKRKMGIDKSKMYALEKVIDIYKYNNGRLPIIKNE